MCKSITAIILDCPKTEQVHNIWNCNKQFCKMRNPGSAIKSSNLLKMHYYAEGKDAALSIRAHFQVWNLNERDRWIGVLDNVPFHCTTSMPLTFDDLILTILVIKYWETGLSTCISFSTFQRHFFTKGKSHCNLGGDRPKFTVRLSHYMMRFALILLLALHLQLLNLNLTIDS